MITDKSKYGHDAVLDVSCDDKVQVLRTAPMELTAEEQEVVRKYLGIQMLSKSYIGANGHLILVTSDGREYDLGSVRGLPGATPYIGGNGNWFVEGVDTLMSARGGNGLTPYILGGRWFIGTEDTGVRAAAQDGLTPYIGGNGNWFIGDTDTGVSASAVSVSTEDRSLAAQKVVPSAAQRAQVLRLGGASYKEVLSDVESVVRAVPVKEIRVNGATVFTVPDAVRSLQDYGLGLDGEQYNYIDFTAKTFVRRVQKKIIVTSTSPTASTRSEYVAALDVPVFTDISDHLTWDGVLSVNAGDVIEFISDTDRAVASVVAYRSGLRTEPWTVTYEDGTTAVKEVYVK